MRLLLVGLVAVPLMGCAQHVMLRHPTTGQMVVCEGKQGWVDQLLARERCIADYKKEGYKEMHSAPKPVSSASPVGQ